MRETNQMAQRHLTIKLAAFIALFLLMTGLVILQLNSGSQSNSSALTTEDSVQWVVTNPAQVSVNWNSGATPTPTPTSSSNSSYRMTTSGTNSNTNSIVSGSVTEP